MQIGGLWIELPLIKRRDGGEVAVLTASREVDFAITLGLTDSLLGPGAGVNVIRLALAAQQIHGHHRELLSSATLQEQHLVIGGNLQQVAQVLFGLLGHRNEFFAAVTHLHDGHAAAMPIEQFLPDLL